MVTFMTRWLLILDVALECCLLAVVYLVHSKQQFVTIILCYISYCLYFLNMSDGYIDTLSSL